MEPQEQLQDSSEELLHFSEMKQKKIETIRKNFLAWKELRESGKVIEQNQPTYQELEGF
jgi:hypothetical protein